LVKNIKKNNDEDEEQKDKQLFYLNNEVYLDNFFNIFKNFSIQKQVDLLNYAETSHKNAGVKNTNQLNIQKLYTNNNNPKNTNFIKSKLKHSEFF
jgi:hypothetical protein